MLQPGERGLIDSLRATAAVAAKLNVKPEQVLICLHRRDRRADPDRHPAGGARSHWCGLGPAGGGRRASAILTTDLALKQIALEADLGGPAGADRGMAKGFRE